MRIGLFGGTFNPPHTAHAEIAKAFIEQFSLDKLYICTDNIPYHKFSSPELIPARHRYNMSRIAFSKISDKIVVSDMEIVRGGNTYTIDTVKELALKYPGADIFVLCGLDMIKTVQSWNRADELISLVTFVCAERAGNDIPDISGARIERLDICADNISSTELREIIKDGKSSPFIDKDVLAYAKANLLYNTENEYDLEAIRKYAFEHEKEKRYIHTLGVAECALEIRNDVAPHIAENTVEAAALLHDITKSLSSDEQIEFMEKAGYTVSENDRAAAKVLHSRTAAILAKKLFGASDTVAKAVWNHTTGAEYMNVLDKIIFLADYIEKNRTYDECVELREYYKKLISESKTLTQRLIALDMTMMRSFEYTKAELLEKKAVIHRDTVLAEQFTQKELKQFNTEFLQAEE